MDVWVGETSSLPEVDLVPLQALEAVQESAFVLLQESVEDSPAEIEEGEALIVTVGVGGATGPENLKTSTSTVRQVEMFDAATVTVWSPLARAVEDL